MAVREGLLALLTEGSRNGYRLKQEFEEATGGVWTLNIGQVYTTLDRLERDGLVSAVGDAGQKTYKITLEGMNALGDWWRAVPADEAPPRDELMLKVLMAIDKGRDHALDVITRQRSALLSLLQAKRQEARRQTSDAGSIAAPAVAELAARLVLDALMVRAEADLRWLDMCEQRVLSLSNSLTAHSAHS